MASTNPLRPQNRTLQNQTGILKQQQEANKLKQSVGSTSRRGSENLDPNNTEAGKGVNKLKTVSRLPVLAKSLQPAETHLSQQNRYEQRSLTGKAQKKKICTKPVPFNLSQSRTHRNTEVVGAKPPISTGTKHRNHQTTLNVFKTANKNQSDVSQTLQTISHQTRTQTDLSSRLSSISLVQNNPREDSGHLYKNLLSKVDVGSKDQAQKDIQIVQSAAGTQSHAESTSALSSSSVGSRCVIPPSSTCPPEPGSIKNMPLRVSVKKSHGDVISSTGNAVIFSHDPSALRSILQNDAARDSVTATPRTSTCPTGRPTSIYSAQRVPVKKPHKDDTEAQFKGSSVSFSPDPSALNSILQNEGIKMGALGGATPRVSTCPTGRTTSIYSAQRVPVKKHNKDNPENKVTGSSVSFSPDPSALNSILKNEGIKMGFLGGATPRVSMCPTGRTTSIYSAQRVPVKKNRTEPTETLSCCANRTPVKKWTPLRVPITNPKSTKKPMTAQKQSRFRDSPSFLNGPQDTTTQLLLQQKEDVVQRLFDDPDQSDVVQTNKCDVTSSTTNHQTITNKENSDVIHHQTEGEGKKAAQPFIQSAHRSSVIVFSSSQRLNQTGSDRSQTEAPLQQICEQSHNATQSNLINKSQVTSVHAGAAKQTNTCAQTQLKVFALRRRHKLEEMILDDECATYTSRTMFCPLQPRCSNPVATTLLFRDSTCFLPIDMSSSIHLSPAPSIRA